MCVTVTRITLIQKKLAKVCESVNGTGNLKGFYEIISSCHSVQNCKINFEMTSLVSLSLPPPSLHHRGKHSFKNIQRSGAPHFLDRQRWYLYVEVYFQSSFRRALAREHYLRQFCSTPLHYVAGVKSHWGLINKSNCRRSLWRMEGRKK